MRKRDKHFVSEIDKKMAEFNASHPKTAAQQVEFNKYQRIYQRRDTVDLVASFKKDSLWD